MAAAAPAAEDTVFDLDLDHLTGNDIYLFFRTLVETLAADPSRRIPLTVHLADGSQLLYYNVVLTVTKGRRGTGRNPQQMRPGWYRHTFMNFAKFDLSFLAVGNAGPDFHFQDAVVSTLILDSANPTLVLEDLPTMYNTKDQEQNRAFAVLQADARGEILDQVQYRVDFGRQSDLTNFLRILRDNQADGVSTSDFTRTVVGVDPPNVTAPGIKRIIMQAPMVKSALKRGEEVAETKLASAALWRNVLAAEKGDTAAAEKRLQASGFHRSPAFLAEQISDLSLANVQAAGKASEADRRALRELEEQEKRLVEIAPYPRVWWFCRHLTC